MAMSMAAFLWASYVIYFCIGDPDQSWDLENCLICFILLINYDKFCIHFIRLCMFF